MADELGTSVPRVLRAARRGRVGIIRRGNRTLFSPEAVAELRSRWGRTPAVPGFRASDLRVLAALARRPFGLRSARAVARQAGLSPTAASRTLRRLAERGLVAHTIEPVAEGTVRDAGAWRIRWRSPGWPDLAVEVAGVELPAPPRRVRRSGRVAARLAHVFWNEDLRALDIDRHGVLIAGRILRSEDPEALAWMASVVPAEAIRSAAAGRGLDRRRARLGEVLAAAR